MARRDEEKAGLPSFFQDNLWLDVLARRGAEPSPDFVASRTSSTPAVGGVTPVIEPEPIANSSTTTSLATGFSRELVVRLKVPSELIEAIRELKEAVIMALSMSQRQATIVPIYIPISVAQMAPQARASVSSSESVPPPYLAPCPRHFPSPSDSGRETEPRASGEVLCPKCGRLGRLYEHKRGRRTYIFVLHGRQKCYLGPADVVKVKWPSLVERSLLDNAQYGRARILSPPGLRPSSQVLSSAQQLERAFLAKRVVRPPGFEPGSPAWKAGVLVQARLRPHRACYRPVLNYLFRMRDTTSERCLAVLTASGLTS